VTPAARIEAAIALLEAVEAAPRRPADAIANDFFRARRFIGSADRRVVSERTWAVLRARRRLGWWLDRVGMAEVPALLVAASLIVEGWDAAGVGQTYSGGRHAPARLEDGALAALGQLQGHTLSHPDMPEAIRLEVPDFLLPLLRARFGAALEAELAAMDGQAPLDLRVNTLKTDRESVRSALAADGIDAELTALSPWGLRVVGRRPVMATRAFQDGLIEIQDEGSQLVAAVVGATPGMAVCDWCAGAGGKTLALAMTMNNRGHIVACDVSAPRLDGAVRRLRRAGVHNAERHLVEPGDKWAKRRAGRFDRVLVDAPCTGTGTWRRNPDARLRLQERDLEELLPKQAAILDVAERLVRPGGRLIYATCSLLGEENEDQVSGFLARHPQFHAVAVEEAWPLDVPTRGQGVHLSQGAYLSLSPRRHGTDGFFAAVLERAV
jgi:16S rRNA (cytosine967-C5)-methyltransferase